MKKKIAILGSAVDEAPQAMNKAAELGRVLSQFYDQIILSNGACQGIPNQVLTSAYKAHRMELWGYSSWRTEEEQRKESPGVDTSIYSKLFYVPEDFQFSDASVMKKYRNVILTASCDVGIIVSGRWGTLNEFTCLVDMGKDAGVLIGTNGIADELPELASKVNKQITGRIIVDDSPQELVNQLLAM